MYELEEVKKYLKDILDEDRIEQCYNLITNPELRVNTRDKKWVACEQSSELTRVFNAICEILNINENERNNLQDSFMEIIQDVCLQFVNWQETFKPRIPFYVLVLDKII